MSTYKTSNDGGGGGGGVVPRCPRFSLITGKVWLQIVIRFFLSGKVGRMNGVGSFRPFYPFAPGHFALTSDPPWVDSPLLVGRFALPGESFRPHWYGLVFIQSTYDCPSTVIELGNWVQTLIIGNYRTALILYFSHLQYMYYFIDTK